MRSQSIEKAGRPILMLLAIAASNCAWGESNAELQRQVRDAETAFAQTMAARDLTAFATFVADDAVFFGREVMRGKAAVIAGWKGLFEGAQPPFSWQSENVEVLASGTLAHSSGPVFGAQGKQTGTFNSTWRREPDGHWKVVFDKGCDACNCAIPRGSERQASFQDHENRTFSLEVSRDGFTAVLKRRLPLRPPL